MKFRKVLMISLGVAFLFTGCKDKKDFSNAYQDKKTSAYVTTASSDVYQMCDYDENRVAYVKVDLVADSVLDWGEYIVPNPTRQVLLDLKQAYPTATLYYNKKKDVILSIPYPEES